MRGIKLAVQIETKGEQEQFMAVNTETGRPVAVKKVLIDKNCPLDRVLKEAEIWAKVSEHPNIPTL